MRTCCERRPSALSLSPPWLGPSIFFAPGRKRQRSVDEGTSRNPQNPVRRPDRFCCHRRGRNVTARVGVCHPRRRFLLRTNATKHHAAHYGSKPSLSRVVRHAVGFAVHSSVADLRTVNAL